MKCIGISDTKIGNWSNNVGLLWSDENLLEIDAGISEIKVTPHPSLIAK